MAVMGSDNIRRQATRAGAVGAGTKSEAVYTQTIRRNMQAFMRHKADNLPPPPTDDAHEHWWEDEETTQYRCLQPMGGRETSEVKKALAALTGVSAFPAPHPCALTVDDVWKLSHFPYKVLFRGQGLRMLLCFLHVQGRTVSVVVSENMMVMRVHCGRAPYALFKGTVLLGFATHAQDGSARFEVLDCLFSKGVNLSRQLWEPRNEACLEAVNTYEGGGTGFQLAALPWADANDEAFWQHASANPEWRTILFVPAGRALKLAASQSTLFELSSLDHAAVRQAMTQEIVKGSHVPEVLPSFRGGRMTRQGPGAHTTRRHEEASDDVPMQELETRTAPAPQLPDGAPPGVGEPGGGDSGAEMHGVQPEAP